MFAEELGGNANRRKQEEARARRRQLKQQQKKKAQEKAQKKVASTTTAGAKSFPAAPAKTVERSPAISTPLVAEAPKPTALSNALQQREKRQLAQTQLKASVTIQSFYRAHRSNCSLLNQQSTLLSQRLKDLATLRVLLKQKANADYVPPPATTTTLTQQLLFSTRNLPYKQRDATRFVMIRDAVNDAKKIQQIFELAILPGIHSQDANLNPFTAWTQSRQGQLRLESIIRLCLVTATLPNIDNQILQTCTRFLRAVTVPRRDSSIHASVLQACRPLLLSQLPPPKAKSNSRYQRHAKLGASLDLISLLRYHLLYHTGSCPIPSTAESVRESCIPASQRSQADSIFQTVLEAVVETSSNTERHHLFIRFISEILTVPLLTWKTSDSSISKLLKERNSSILLLSMIESFSEHHSEILSMGDIQLVLCQDTSLIHCPAAPSQCLLANMIQLASSCIQLNGSDVNKLHCSSVTRFYRFIATLVDAVPIGTFSSRESVVEWISDGKGHHSPVVLSPVVMGQCKFLLADSFVRKLFHGAIDKKSLKTDEILKLKTEKDLKHEKNLQEAGATAASLAAKEARVERNKSFFKSSGWARRLKKGVSKMISGEKNKTTVAKSSGASEKDGKLINASLVSRQLASGETKKPIESHTEDVPRVSYSKDLLMALCRVYGTVLARWGGGGAEDIVGQDGPRLRQDVGEIKREVATSKAEICTQTLLNVLCFSTSLIQASWGMIQSDADVVSNIYEVIDPTKGKQSVRCLQLRPNHSNNQYKSSRNDGAALFFVFICALQHMLIITDDTEIHDMERPLPLHQVRRCIETLKQLLFRACCIDENNSAEYYGGLKRESTYFGLALISVTSKVMRDLYDRSSRRPLCAPKLWLINDLMEDEIRRCKTEYDYVSLLSSPVLRVCPFLVSFKRRLKLFERIVTTNRVTIQGENSPNPFHSNPLKPGLPVRITRGRILEDGLATLNNLGRNMRQRIAVQYHNEAGTRESGIDAGGLFKEFWTDLSAIAFDPNYALFRVTEENCMYPSPSSGAAHGSEHIVLFEFLGRILGKALYEGITIHPQFAHFFLSFLRGDYNYFHMLSDLSTMDVQLYNNIMFLKTYEGDAEDLCLTFAITNDDFGGNTEIQLIKNGLNIPVTNANKQRYVGLVAKYYVVDRVKEQSEAFTRGLWEVIDRSWLKIFNEPELQILISGPSDGKIDVDDMRSNCRYVGGFTGLDPSIHRFWKVVASFDSKNQAELLRFVTSCERPPPLGFASMNPPFTIQRVGIMRDGDKLPSASTCFNVLKLPTYSSEKVMRERLLFAIQSGAGFELS